MVAWQRDGFEVSTDPERLDLDAIHAFLTRSYWAQGIAYEAVARSVAHALCFGVYQGDAQVGFARVITDFTRLAYVADVFILEPHRGQGLSKWLVECILAHPDLQAVPSWLLATRDAHGLYARYGFEPLPEPDRYMLRRSPGGGRGANTTPDL